MGQNFLLHDIESKMYVLVSINGEIKPKIEKEKKNNKYTRHIRNKYRNFPKPFLLLSWVVDQRLGVF